jgi:hypothetical protein
VVDIHDSDITTVTYRPTRRGSGVAYLGVTKGPRWAAVTG